MALDANGEWDGVCACGKKEMDGVRCIYGATHEPLKPKPMPWEVEKSMLFLRKEFPWQR